MTYIPHTDSDREAMLKVVGVERLEDLFQDVPARHRFPKLDLPAALSEMETMEELQDIAAANENTRELVSFLGAGAYNHYIPAAVDSLLRRGEFFTAYTPYQPEVAQGTLQAIFEYQSLVAALTGMETCNASHYDGATAVAEAVNMAFAQFRGKRCKVVLSPALNPQYRETVRTYTPDVSIQMVGDGPEAGDPLSQKPEALIPLIDTNTALVIVQYPDFFGRIYDLTALAEATHQMGALLCVGSVPHRPGYADPARRLRSRYRHRRRAAFGHPAFVRGPIPGIVRYPQRLRAQNGRQAGRRDG